jgi:hypothetical protein
MLTTRAITVEAAIINKKPIIHHFIISFAFFIFSSSQVETTKSKAP